MDILVSFIKSAIPLGVPLLYGSTGEILTEKSGHLNLGIPGIMYVGAISGVIGAFFYEMACGARENMVPALAILIPLLCYGDVLLPLAGVNLPFDPMVSFFLFYVASQAAQVLLYWRCRNLVECTYVGAYDTLCAEQVLPSPWNN